MSEVTHENGGKSPKTPTLRTPAFVMSSRASARAAAPKARPQTRAATARPVRRRVENLVIARVLRESSGPNQTWLQTSAGSSRERFVRSRSNAAGFAAIGLKAGPAL